MNQLRLILGCGNCKISRSDCIDPVVQIQMCFRRVYRGVRSTVDDGVRLYLFCKIQNLFHIGDVKLTIHLDKSLV